MSLFFSGSKPNTPIYSVKVMCAELLLFAENGGRWPSLAAIFHTHYLHTIITRYFVVAVFGNKPI